MIYLSSTFSPAMLADVQAGKVAQVTFMPCPLGLAIKLIAPPTEPGDHHIVSGVGHPATAAMIESLTGCALPPVDPANRVKLSLKQDDILLVFQYLGPRLSEWQIMSAGEVEAASLAGHFTWLVVTSQGHARGCSL